VCGASKLEATEEFALFALPGLRSMGRGGTVPELGSQRSGNVARALDCGAALVFPELVSLFDPLSLVVVGLFFKAALAKDEADTVSWYVGAVFWSAAEGVFIESQTIYFRFA
jgi:hypothetical protein